MRGTGLRPEQIRLAAAYYHDFPDEIDARIASNAELEQAAEAALRALATA